MDARKMIIIGSSNNYNELGLVRSFGVNGIKPYGIIVCSKKMWRRDWLHRSRYWKHCYRVDSGEEAIRLLIKNFGEESVKPSVTTPVDYIVQMIDKRYDALSKKFVIQSIQGKANEIVHFSDKLNQFELTKKLGFNVLPTKIININNYEQDKELSFEYPVLLKPAACGEGSKDDIVICNDQNELLREVKRLKEKKYVRILCQKYLSNRTEIIAYGALSKKYNLCSYTVLKNIRQWPESYGVGSYGELVLDEHIIKFVDQFYKAIMNFGYDGPIDTDIFVDNNTGSIYVSEYNWRPGGRNYTSLGTKVYSIVLWFLLHDSKDIRKYKIINDTTGYTMNEATDFNHVINGDISLKKWKQEFFKSIAHALIIKNDIPPVFIVVISLIKKWILSRITRGKI